MVKSAIQQAFVDNGATLSHHHAVGTEHARWLEQDISAPGVGCSRRCSTAPTRARTSTRARSCDRGPGGSSRGMCDRSPEELDEPWSRTRRARAVREFLVCGVLGPLMDLYTRRRCQRPRAARGAGRRRPCSWPTTPATWTRRRCCAPCRGAPAPAHRGGRGGGLLLRQAPQRAGRVSLVFGTVPVDRERRRPDEECHRASARLIDDGGTLLMFAEGTRTNDGSRPAEVRRRRAGRPAGRAAGARLRRRARTRRCRAATTGWSSASGRGARHPIEIRFGEPMRPREGEEPAETMERVRLFLAESGAATDAGPRVAAAGASRA